MIRDVIFAMIIIFSLGALFVGVLGEFDALPQLLNQSASEYTHIANLVVLVFLHIHWIDVQ